MKWKYESNMLNHGRNCIELSGIFRVVYNEQNNTVTFIGDEERTVSKNRAISILSEAILFLTEDFSDETIT